MTRTKPLILLGWGGHARVVADAARLSGINLLGYFDDDAVRGDSSGKIKEDDPPYLGTVDRWAEFLANAEDEPSIHAAVGEGKLREEWLSNMEERTIVTIIHPAAVVSESARLGAGVFVGPGAIINAGARIGRGVIINTGAIIEHDAVIGAFSHIAPGAILTGEVEVGEQALIGAGATVLPGVKIGACAVLGAGAVAVRNLAEGCRAMGIPAREAINRVIAASGSGATGR